MDLWVIPPGHDAEFVRRREPVRDERPFDPDRPSVNIDEASVPLIEETRAPVPPEPGQPARVDDEYKRNGTANLFVAFPPLLGWREVVVTERRTARDFAAFVKHLADDLDEEAEKITRVLDNRNTHSPASLYPAFEPAEAHRLAGRFERTCGSCTPSPTTRTGRWSASTQEERLKKGEVGYKVTDALVRPGKATNCIHAVSDIDTERGLLVTVTAHGNEASRKVVSHLARWRVESKDKQEWLAERLELGKEIVRRETHTKAAEGVRK